MLLFCVSIVSRYVAEYSCLQQGRISRIERTRVSVECEIPVIKVFARCVRLWLSDSHVLWARFRHRLSQCSHGFRVLSLLRSSQNLFLTIPALKPNDLNKTLKHITDWASEPITRKSTSCTLCFVDQFLLTIECRGQGTALSSGESELYALGTVS